MAHDLENNGISTTVQLPDVYATGWKYILAKQDGLEKYAGPDIGRS